MKVLLIGGKKIGNAALALEQRFSTLQARTADSAELIKTIGRGGERFDRIIIFEQAVTRDGQVIESRMIRESAQMFMDAIKDSFEAFDLVGVADDSTVLQVLKEEMFDIKHRAVTVKIKNNVLSASMLAAIASKSIGELRDIYQETDVDRSIYRSVSSVMWSSEIEKPEDWDLDMSDGRAAVKLNSGNMKFNPMTGKFEEVQDEKVTGHNIESSDTGTVSVNTSTKKPKGRGLFGNRKA